MERISSSDLKKSALIDERTGSEIDAGTVAQKKIESVNIANNIVDLIAAMLHGDSEYIELKRDLLAQSIFMIRK